MIQPGTDALRVQKWVVAISVILLAIKFTAYFLTHSVAILTDALESIVNVVAGMITLYSLYVAAKPRDAEHPYGHGKAEFLSAGVEGTLITLAGIWIMVEAVDKFLHPQPIQKLDTGIILIAAGGLVNFAAGYFAELTGKRQRSLAITATGKHLKSDAYSTAGLVAGLLLMLITGYPWIDSAIAVIFGAIIIITGWGILRKSIAGIMDEADESLLEQLVAVLNKHRRPCWVDLHNLRIIKYGSRLHVDCHLTLPWYYNLNEAHTQIDELENIIRAELGDQLELFTHTDGCLPKSCAICPLTPCPHRQANFEKRIDWTVINIFENQKHELITP
ncbi:MAG TPA: cation diffusion facilitator family transporter [Phnomibacter sp.]|nr:cation diffusion facilitator family transporter [Phnomibacter sp.]